MRMINNNVERKKRIHSIWKRVISVSLCLCLLASMFPQTGRFLSLETLAGDSSVTPGTAKHIADPETMYSYGDILNLNESTRNAGRLWADKSVFTEDQLQLTAGKDGVNATIPNAGDFLHVYSALGSSQAFIGVPPTRTVIVFDNSGSMYGNSKEWEKTRTAITIESINRAIDSLMEAGAYNQVAVVLFGDGSASKTPASNTTLYDGNSTAVTIIPMAHYTPQKGTNGYTEYLKAGWSEDIADGSDLNHTTSASGGWVFVDHSNAPVGDKKSGYTAYRNGTTNINAGYAVGMRELLKAEKVQQVGNERFDCIPALVMLTDGAATDMLTCDYKESIDGTDPLESRGFVNDTGNRLRGFAGYNKKDSKEVYNFWDMHVEKTKKEDGTLHYSLVGEKDYVNNDTTNPAKKPGGAGLAAMQNLANTYSDSVSAMLLNTLLTTAYGKSRVEKEYNGNICNIYTVSVDMLNPASIGENEVANAIESDEILPKNYEKGITSNAPTVDPGKYFLNLDWMLEKGYVNSEGTVSGGEPNNTNYPAWSVGSMILQGIANARRDLDRWYKGETVTHTYRSWNSVSGIVGDMKDGTMGNTTSLEGTASKPPTGVPGHNDGYLWEEEQTVGYPSLDDNAYGVTKDDIQKNIDYAADAYYVSTGTAGANEIQNAFSSIINEINQPVFTPVIGTNDFSVEDGITYMDPIGRYMEIKDVDSVVLFGQQYELEKDQTYNPFDTTGTQLTREALEKYLPYKNTADMEKLDNTVVTLYKMNADQSVLDMYRLNPSYTNMTDDEVLNKYQGATYNNPDGKSVTVQNADQAWEAYLVNEMGVTAANYTKKPGVYRLRDLKIWTEDNESYADSLVEDSAMMTDTGYRRSLWVNVPSAALPIQRVTLDYRAENAAKGKYTTNIGVGEKGHYQDLPLRVIYSVGISADIMKSDGSAVDLTKVSKSYLDYYKITTENEDIWSNPKNETNDVAPGDVVFFSNWYSGGSYDGYHSSLQPQSFGDPGVSFSPGTSNQYYFDQKETPKYSAAWRYDGSSWVQIKPGNDDSDSKGALLAVLEGDSDLIPVALAAQGIAPKLGDIVFLKGDVLAGAPAPDQWYFTSVDYYINEAETAQAKQDVVVRYGTDRLRAGDLYQNISEKSGKVTENGYHENNLTRTAENVYLPTVGSGEGKVNVNIYLGNNGRLTVTDSEFLTTKTIKDKDPGAGDRAIMPQTRFQYVMKAEINDKGLTGDHNLIVVKRISENPDVWKQCLSYIDLLCDSRGYLRKDDGKGSGAIQVYADGTPANDASGRTEPQYYVSIGSEHNGKLRIYSGDSGFDSGIVTTAEKAGGELLISLNQVQLIPVEGGATITKDFPILTYNASDPGETEIAIASDYCFDAVYQTVTVHFDENHCGSFSLGDGEGLLLNGLPVGTKYSVTESVTKEQYDDGFDFQSVEHQTTLSGNVVKEKADFSDGKYTVNGSTTVSPQAVHYTNIWHHEKTETSINGEPVDPGKPANPGVQVGDEITYVINWVNDALDEKGNPASAAVTITDRLDPGVDFVEADPPGNYDASAHTVIWELGTQAANVRGTIRLVVRVNEKAVEYWDYDEDGIPDEKVDPDYTVRNRATVRVAENEYDTNTERNPVGQPDKNEVSIQHEETKKPLTEGDFTEKADKKNTVLGPLVYVGDQITYEITWRNYESVPAAVTVRDPLDPNVKFVSAEFTSAADISDYSGAGNASLNTPQTESVTTVTVGTETQPVIRYDEEKHQLIWNLGVQPAGMEGKVTLTVEVLPTATNAGKVENTAYVKVNGDPEQHTKTVENPTPEINKTEENPGDTKPVQTGQTIQYRLSWDSKSENEETTTKIVVTDPLDPGVDFVSAAYQDVTLAAPIGWDGKSDLEEAGGSVAIRYNAETHTVTWMLTGDAAKEKGEVLLSVKVNQEALTGSSKGLKGPEIGEDADWNYRSGDALETSGDQLVQNRGAIAFNNDAAIVTELVTNPLRKTGGIKIKKLIDGVKDSELSKAFTFEITLTSDIDFYPELFEATLTSDTEFHSVLSENRSDVVLNWFPEKGPTKSVTAQFYLKHGETIEISGIPAHVKYTVKETGREGYDLLGIQKMEDAESPNLGDTDTETAYGDIPEEKWAGMIFLNVRGVSVPKVGGSGTGRFYLAGSLLLAWAPAVLLYRQRKKRRAEVMADT